jgi:4-diphosphocytidyl-2-C-methyl-D-erythritol kinase
MQGHIEIETYAKINLGLGIGAPEESGFHPLLGIFHSTGPVDLLRMHARLAPGRHRGSGSQESTIEVQGSFDCPPETTSIHKAARLFFGHCGIRGDVFIEVEKRIPAMGGMGGGSSDAAATLAGLDALYGTGLDRETLMLLGAKLGSDVPFFFGSSAALVSGRGDIIEAIEPRTDFGILLVFPGFGVSTGWAYGTLDAWRALHSDARALDEEAGRPGSASRTELLKQFKGPICDWRFKNDFSPMLFEHFPVYGTLESLLKEAGARYVSITGSGSTMYGIFDSPAEATEAEAALTSGKAGASGSNTLCGMALRAVKPLDTTMVLG